MLIRFLRYVVLAAVASMSACGSSPQASPALPVEPTPAVAPVLSRTVVMAGLSAPWDIAFATDGTMFYTEKCLGLSVRFSDGTVTRLFGPAAASLAAPDFWCEGQSGMHGIALDPAFATNRRIYVFMASSLSAPRTNRVVRLVLSADRRTASQRTDIVTDITYKNGETANGGAGSHSGGRLRFGPDGLLYITTGDNHNALVPQSPTLLGGKVLRVTTDGTAAVSNAPPTGFDRRIFTFGHRNVQGLSFRPGTGQPFTGEHGPNHTDEVTPLINGGNGGWDPKSRPALNCPDSYCGYAGTATSMPMTDVARFPAAMRAAWINNGASQGMGPVEFLSGAQWSLWNGRLAVALMGGTRLEILDLDTNGMAISNTNAGLPAARYRSLVQAPDGSLYVATDAGDIWKVTPGR